MEKGKEYFEIGIGYKTYPILVSISVGNLFWGTIREHKDLWRGKVGPLNLKVVIKELFNPRNALRDHGMGLEIQFLSCSLINWNPKLGQASPQSVDFSFISYLEFVYPHLSLTYCPPRESGSYSTSDSSAIWRIFCQRKADAIRHKFDFRSLSSNYENWKSNSIPQWKWITG